MTAADESERAVDALVERGERDGSVPESEIERLAEELALDPARLEELREGLAERGIAVEDDCGRPAAPMRYANGHGTESPSMTSCRRPSPSAVKQAGVRSTCVTSTFS